MHSSTSLKTFFHEAQELCQIYYEICKKFNNLDFAVGRTHFVLTALLLAFIQTNFNGPNSVLSTNFDTFDKFTCHRITLSKLNVHTQLEMYQD